VPLAEDDEVKPKRIKSTANTTESKSYDTLNNTVDLKTDLKRDLKRDITRDVKTDERFNNTTDQQSNKNINRIDEISSRLNSMKSSSVEPTTTNQPPSFTKSLSDLTVDEGKSAK